MSVYTKHYLVTSDQWRDDTCKNYNPLQYFQLSIYVLSRKTHESVTRHTISTLSVGIHYDLNFNIRAKFKRLENLKNSKNLKKTRKFK